MEVGRANRIGGSDKTRGRKNLTHAEQLIGQVGPPNGRLDASLSGGPRRPPVGGWMVLMSRAGVVAAFWVAEGQVCVSVWLRVEKKVFGVKLFIILISVGELWRGADIKDQRPGGA